VGEVRGYKNGCTKQMGGQGRLEGGRLVILTKSELHHMWMTGLSSHGRFFFRIFLSRRHYV
jgi:hypothetical protein